MLDIVLGKNLKTILLTEDIPGFLGFVGFLVGHFCRLQLPRYLALLLQCLPPLCRLDPVLLPPPQLFEHFAHWSRVHLHAMKMQYGRLNISQQVNNYINT